jgi:hypothetical protein
MNEQEIFEKLEWFAYSPKALDLKINICKFAMLCGFIIGVLIGI